MKEENLKTKEGTVVYINTAKGYGFISPTENQDRKDNLFFHITNILNMSIDKIRYGNKVEFFERETEKGKEAYEVVVL